MKAGCWFGVILSLVCRPLCGCSTSACTRQISVNKRVPKTHQNSTVDILKSRARNDSRAHACSSTCIVTISFVSCGETTGWPRMYTSCLRIWLVPDRAGGQIADGTSPLTPSALDEVGGEMQPATPTSPSTACSCSARDVPPKSSASVSAADLPCGTRRGCHHGSPALSTTTL